MVTVKEMAISSEPELFTLFNLTNDLALSPEDASYICGFYWARKMQDRDLEDLRRNHDGYWADWIDREMVEMGFEDCRSEMEER